MALYTDETYATIHETPPVMQPDDFFYVGVVLLGGEISSDIFLLVEDCWATAFIDPESFPRYPLINEGYISIYSSLVFMLCIIVAYTHSLCISLAEQYFSLLISNLNFQF